MTRFLVPIWFVVLLALTMALGTASPSLASPWNISWRSTSSRKHPNIGLDARFQMPYRIDSTEVGEHTLTLRQK